MLKLNYIQTTTNNIRSEHAMLLMLKLTFYANLWSEEQTYCSPKLQGNRV